MAFLISPYHYGITLNRKENTNYVLAFTFHGSSHQELFVKESARHLWSKNPLVFSMTLILTINNVIVEQLFAERRFLKNTSA